MQEYVHTGIIKIIMNGLSKFSPSLEHRNNEIWDLIYLNPEKFPAEKKSKLLEQILSEEGIDILLKLGESCKGETNFPLLYVLLNSPSPEILIDKLEQYYQYFHSTKRIQVADRGDNYLLINHISAANQPISAAEDIFVCGILLTLLELVGCQQLSYKWQKINDSKLYYYLDSCSQKNVHPNSFSQWRFTWESFQPSCHIHGLDDFILKSSKPCSSLNSNTISETIKSLISQDLSRKWHTRDIATTLLISPRSLQRKLQKERCSLTKILRTLRLKTAEKMVIETQFSLTEIGYMVGFSDHAHFSREFKKIKGLSPLSYRKKMLG